MCNMEEIKSILSKPYLLNSDICTLMSCKKEKARKLRLQMLSETDEKFLIYDDRYTPTGPFVRWTGNEMYLVIYEKILKDLN